MPSGVGRLSMASGSPFRVRAPSPPPPLVKAELGCDMPSHHKRERAEDSSNNYQTQDKFIQQDKSALLLVIVGAVFGRVPLGEEGYLAH